MISSLILLGLLAPGSSRVQSIQPIPAPTSKKVWETLALGISNSGYVHGMFRVRPGDNRLQIWSERTGPVEIVAPEGVLNPGVHALNNRGEVVGEYMQGNLNKAFKWSIDGGFQTITGLGPYARAWGINDRGDIVATTRNAGQWPERIGVLRGGNALFLEPLPGYLHTMANAINGAGLVIGRTYGDEMGKPDVATVWDKAGMPTAIPLVNGANGQEPLSINDHGDVVGSARTDSGSKMFLYHDGKTTLLPDAGGPSSPYAINNRGQIVGGTQRPDRQEFAFLIEDGKLIDLNDLLPASSGWKLRRATGINDRGEIVGSGTFEDRPQAFLLKLK